VALIHGNELYVANAGDSRAVLCSKDRAVEMSLDHKPDLPVERERIYSAGGYIQDGRVKGSLNLSRAIGDLEFKANHELEPAAQMITSFPDVKQFVIGEHETFLLMGCDGIWESEKSNDYFVSFCSERLAKGWQIRRVLEDLLDSVIAPDTLSKLRRLG